MPCLHNIELIAENNTTHIINPDGKKKQSKMKPKCPNCRKVLKYEQNYIENKYVKPLEQTHTIIMAHNLNILHYIYKKIVCKNLASVGYYIGGMKESELKNSETKQVILASFCMCSEGLDIPTLNTEFLITPKTDIVQIVGRILRAKHAFSHPIIYDFVDSHDVFQRQWLKRKSYYKKQNYTIIGTNSIEYNTDISKWKNIYDPKIGKLTITKPTSMKSDSSTNDSDSDSDFENESEENAPKDKYLSGKCLLQKKIKD
jgi:superfamily II DNA or RNA helicase